MYKIVLLIVILNASLIYTLNYEDSNIYGENYVTTETNNTNYQEIPAVETNKDHQAEKTEVEPEQYENTKESGIPIAPESFDEVKTERVKIATHDFDLKKAVISRCPEWDLFTPGYARLTSDREVISFQYSTNNYAFPILGAEIKAWTENLDCFTSSLGPLKCRMVKKLAKRLFQHSVLADIDFRKVAAHLRAAIKKLDDGDKPMNTEIRNLIQKYKKFLYVD